MAAEGRQATGPGQPDKGMRADAAAVPKPVAAGPEMAALGWGPEHGEYRAVMADNYGHADVYRGHIDGDRLVFESIAGPRLRLTWDASSPGIIIWRNEMSLPDGSWFLIEEYPMIPA